MALSLDQLSGIIGGIAEKHGALSRDHVSALEIVVENLKLDMTGSDADTLVATIGSILYAFEESPEQEMTWDDIKFVKELVDQGRDQITLRSQNKRKRK